MSLSDLLKNDVCIMKEKSGSRPSTAGSQRSSTVGHGRPTTAGSQQQASAGHEQPTIGSANSARESSEARMQEHEREQHQLAELEKDQQAAQVSLSGTRASTPVRPSSAPARRSASVSAIFPTNQSSASSPAKNLGSKPLSHCDPPKDDMGIKKEELGSRPATARSQRSSTVGHGRPITPGSQQLAGAGREQPTIGAENSPLETTEAPMQQRERERQQLTEREKEEQGAAEVSFSGIRALKRARPASAPSRRSASVSATMTPSNQSSPTKELGSKLLSLSDLTLLKEDLNMKKDKSDSRPATAGSQRSSNVGDGRPITAGSQVPDWDKNRPPSERSTASPSSYASSIAIATSRSSAPSIASSRSTGRVGSEVDCGSRSAASVASSAASSYTPSAISASFKPASRAGSAAASEATLSRPKSAGSLLDSQLARLHQSATSMSPPYASFRTKSNSIGSSVRASTPVGAAPSVKSMATTASARTISSACTVSWPRSASVRTRKRTSDEPRRGAGFRAVHAGRSTADH